MGVHSVGVEGRSCLSPLLLLHLREKSAVSSVLLTDPLGCQIRVDLQSTSWTINYVVVKTIRDVQHQTVLSISLESRHGIGSLHTTILGRFTLHSIHHVADAARICIISHAILLLNELLLQIRS